MRAAMGAAVSAARRRAESLMVDSCRIERSTPGAWDEGTGMTGDPILTLLYEGRCRLRNAAPAPQNADAGETVWMVDLFTLSLPIAGTEGITSGDVVTLTGSAYDPASVGAQYVVASGHVQTHSTARRLPVKAVTRDA